MRLLTLRQIILGMLCALSLVASRAEALDLKGGVLFKANDTDIDTSDSQWIVGISQDKRLLDFLSLGFEVDFTYESVPVQGTDEKLNVYFIYPYVNAKLHLPLGGIGLYGGVGVGYSPIISSFGGNTEQIGGIGTQVLGGLSLGTKRTRLFVEAQYKVTDIENSGSYQLFALYGGIGF